MASDQALAHGTIRQRLDLALHQELRDSETIAWQGMKLARVETKGFAVYLFAIPWTAFSVFWTTMAAVMTSGDTSVMGWVFPLFGLPFVLVGFGMLATPFVPYFQRGRILFAVTNERVLKLSLGRELTVNSVPASRIGDISRIESADGTGSVDIALSSGTAVFNAKRSNRMRIGRVDAVRGAYAAVLELSQRD